MLASPFAALLFDIERDLIGNPARYAEAVTWWNGHYTQKVRRREIATRLRATRRRSRPRKSQQEKGWKAQNLAGWTFLARVRDAMAAFPRDPADWHRLPIQQAKKILLVAVLIVRPDWRVASSAVMPGVV